MNRNMLWSIAFTIQNQFGRRNTETKFITSGDSPIVTLKDGDVVECEIENKPIGDFRIIHVGRGIDNALPYIHYLIRSVEI